MEYTLPFQIKYTHMPGTIHHEATSENNRLDISQVKEDYNMITNRKDSMCLYTIWISD